MRSRWLCLVVSTVATLSFAPAWSQDPKPGEQEPLNKRFEDPKLDVEGFVKRFESESREVAALRNEILALCEIKPGMSVADVGAGTGLYTFPFAEKVGPEGAVYAVEISPAFLKHLGDEARKKGLARVIKPVKGGHETTNLPPGSVDLVFLCDTYHHFEKPVPMLASIFKALRPGGRVVVIDFDKHPGASAFIKSHARAEKEVYFKEFEAAGFVKAEVKNPPKLGENFIALFRKPAKP